MSDTVLLFGNMLYKRHDSVMNVGLVQVSSTGKEAYQALGPM